MIMFVCVNALYSIVFLEIVLDQEIKYLHINWNLGESDKDSTCYFLYSDLIEPGMLSDV